MARMRPPDSSMDDRSGHGQREIMPPGENGVDRMQRDGRRGTVGFLESYLAIDARAASIFAFTASRLKLAPFCIGGNSIAVMASFSTCCWTNTKRQNSYLNQSKYCWAPYLVPLSGQPVRSNGSRRRLIR